MCQTEEDVQGKLSHLCQCGKSEERKETHQDEEVVDTINDNDFQIKRRKGKESDVFLFSCAAQLDFFYFNQFCEVKYVCGMQHML